MIGSAEPAVAPTSIASARAGARHLGCRSDGTLRMDPCLRRGAMMAVIDHLSASGARARPPIADRQLFRVAGRRLAASIGRGWWNPERPLLVPSCSERTLGAML